MSKHSPFLHKLFFIWKYLASPPWDTRIPAPELVSAISNLKAGRALDIGCGGGTNVCYLAEHGWQATGVDFVPRAVSIAKQRLRKKKLTADVRVGDVTRLDKMDLDGPFQLALDIGCFHAFADNVNDVNGYLRGLRRWLAGGGLYLLYVHESNPDSKIVQGIERDFVEETFSGEMDLKTYSPGTEGNWRSAWYVFTKK